MSDVGGVDVGVDVAVDVEDIDVAVDVEDIDVESVDTASVECRFRTRAKFGDGHVWRSSRDPFFGPIKVARLSCI